MKKTIKLIGTVSLVAILSVSTVFAATALKKVTGYMNPSVNVTVDGKAIEIKDSLGKTVAPVNIGGSNYVPLKSISDITGKKVSYDSKTNTVIIGAKNVPNWVEGFPKYSGELTKITNKKFLDYTYEKTSLNQFNGIMMTGSRNTEGKIKVKDKLTFYLVASAEKESFQMEERNIQILDKNNIVLAKISYANNEFDKPYYIELKDLGETELTVKINQSGNDFSKINCMIIDPKTMIDTNN